MIKSKLFRALDTITMDEWKPLRSFLAGVVGVEHDVFRLFKFIYTSRKNLKNRKFKMDKANEALCPHLSRKSFQNIMSMLLHEIEAYWIWNDLRKDKLRWNMHRLEALNQRALYHEADKALAKITATTSDDNFLDLWKNYYLLRASHTIFFSNNPLRSRQPQGKDTLSTSVTSSISFIGNLVNYYEAEIYNDMHVNHASWEKELKLIEPLRSIKDDSLLTKSLQAQVQFVKTRYTDDAQILTQIVKNENTKISPDLRLTYYYRIRRSMIIKARAGDRSTIRELRKFIFWSIDSGLLIYNNQLYINRFIGDLNVLCALKENKLARKYISNYSSMLHLSFREEGMTLGEMIVNFADHSHDHVITSYRYTNFRKADHKLQAAGLFLRSSFELYGPDILFFESHLRNISSFIVRNKTQLSSFQITSWKNFLRIFTMIVKKSKVKDIIHIMSEKPNMIHHGWIEDKIKRGNIS